jgi:hypothetical protein
LGQFKKTEQRTSLRIQAGLGPECAPADAGSSPWHAVSRATHSGHPALSIELDHAPGASPRIFVTSEFLFFVNRENIATDKIISTAQTLAAK